MAISTMYPAMPGSPKTTLTADITASDTSLTVADGNALPVAPNILVVGNEENAEVICYNAKSGNTVSGLIRALGGTVASAWTAGTEVARNFTSFDHDRFKENIEDLATNKADSADVYTQTEIDTLLNAKQNKLTFDNSPTANSSNPVKSNGIKTALDGKQNTLTFDSSPTANSSNPVKSSGIKTALDGKQNTLTFDSSPTASSSNPVKSSGIKTALDGKANSSHTHGNISNAGGISTSVTIGNGDAIVITDSSASDVLKKTSITFDGASDDKALTQKGTWVSFDDGISASDWDSLPNSNSLYTGEIHYRKVGKLVQITCTGVKLATDLNENSRVIDTVPSNFRPKYSAMILVQTYVNYPTAMMVSTNGQVTFYKGNGNSTWKGGTSGASINANGMYFTN